MKGVFLRCTFHDTQPSLSLWVPYCSLLEMKSHWIRCRSLVRLQFPDNQQISLRVVQCVLSLHQCSPERSLYCPAILSSLFEFSWLIINVHIDAGLYFSFFRKMHSPFLAPLYYLAKYVLFWCYLDLCSYSHIGYFCQQWISLLWYWPFFMLQWSLLKSHWCCWYSITHWCCNIGHWSVLTCLPLLISPWPLWLSC